MKNVLITSSIAAILFVTGFFILDKKQNIEAVNTNKTVAKVERSEQTKPTKVQENIGSKSKISKEDIEKYLSSKRIPESDLHDIKLSRGYFDISDRKAFEQYDIETLQQMSENGDMLAHQALAWKLAEQGEYRQGLQVLMHSAVIGDVNALETMKVFSSMIKGSAEKGFIERDEALELLSMKGYKGDLNRAMRISQKAYLNAAKLRGKMDTALFDLEMSNEIPLTPEEEVYAQTLAYNIYEVLSGSRRNKGLEEFDNTVYSEYGAYHNEYFAQYNQLKGR